MLTYADVCFTAQALTYADVCFTANVQAQSGAFYIQPLLDAGYRRLLSV
jgi:hypothetical protein